jgi:hypothetical protein
MQAASPQELPNLTNADDQMIPTIDTRIAIEMPSSWVHTAAAMNTTLTRCSHKMLHGTFTVATNSNIIIDSVTL